jgi:hypothetical protein
MAVAQAEDVAKRLRDAIAALNRHDLDPYIAMMDPAFEIDDPNFPEPVKGKEVVRKLNEDLGEALPDMEFEILSMAAGDDVVAAEVKGSATFTGPLKLPMGTIPPTGRRLEFVYAAFYRFNSRGLLTKVRNYGLDLPEMLGLQA